ncbi:MAG: peptidoglycan-binding domain-containing protein [Planctomycetia bacterium]|nr:peptidoglycan-binding domain-containing protein [Planctomycetia bacterium]
MKRTICILTCVFFLAFLLAGSAFADLQRGDQSEEVSHLQTMLFETGFLFEEPDGSFGKNTEQAVKDYQKYIGAKITGIATDDLMEQLQETWYEVVYGGQPEANTGDGGIYPAFCNHWSDQQGNSKTDYCETHMAVRTEVEKLIESGSDENARRACELWKDEINRLYEIWKQHADDSSFANISASQALFWSSIDARESAVRSSYDKSNVDTEGLPQTDYAMEVVLREHAAWLCDLLSSLYGDYE